MIYFFSNEYVLAGILLNYILRMEPKFLGSNIINGLIGRFIKDLQKKTKRIADFVSREY